MRRREGVSECKHRGGGGGNGEGEGGRGGRIKREKEEPSSRYLIRKVCAQRLPKLPDCLTGLDGGRVEKTPSVPPRLAFGSPTLTPAGTYTCKSLTTIPPLCV